MTSPQPTMALATPTPSTSTTATSNGNNNNNNENNNDNESPLLQLPPSDPNKNDDNIQTLKMGEAIKLDHLGPIILNTDGTTRRIDNWDILTEKEREVTWRRIKKRNEERRQALLEQQTQQQEQQQQEEEK